MYSSLLQLVAFTTTATLPALTLAKSCARPPRLGAVASETTICSNVGIDILHKHHGNAVDAAVATVLCNGVVAMYHSGPGGGSFALIRSKTGEYEFIDFRETAPAAAFEDMYKEDENLSLYGGLASGVPGELRGLEYMHNKYGSLPWADLVAPSIKIAREGWTVNEDLVKYMTGASYLVTDPNWAIDFAPNGTLLQLGDTITRKRYADFLESIAQGGAQAFYTGENAEYIIAELTKQGGTMTLADLANYTVAPRPTLDISYKGYKVTSCSAPSSGSVVLSSLKITDGYAGFDDPAQVNISAHRLVESLKWAYGQRAELGDPSFVPGLDKYQASMISDAAAAEIRSRISDVRTFNTSYYNPKGLESLETPGTAHFATADASGMAVSMTSTVNLIFGSRVMIPELGLVMNDQMNDFSIPGKTNAFGYLPSPANFVRPGKRPLSSMSPSIVETPEGKLYFVIGAAGGSRIITANIQNIHNVLDLGMTSAAALRRPRLHHQLSPEVIQFEYTFDNGTVAFLKGVGHNVTWVAPGASAAEGVRLLPNGTFEAAGEPRLKNSGGFAI
ncbi:gamma-glutamyltranspeptidase [Microdochium trichocladiopsis]|uniref:Glutathione hydrolase n=1 Tax=Microdochium trichocladiopsis TaxID=1682393 RepID=A0A9P8XWS8_9PEZI|nr:gamma-glutamyltranspeptidase [Microdochium trichocladiopsis]KAH7018424.1 gamma-glutamyltranspeptidase [Microdochium trichocladiopsis]